MDTRTQYPTDLTDTEWTDLEPFVPAPKCGGRPRVHPVREIVNASFYMLRSGCAWRRLPHDLPPWKTVYHSCRLWRLAGVWAKVPTTLREAVRIKAGRDPQPSAGILESQSVNTTGVGGTRGDAGAKKLRGRKRHPLVDTQGMVLQAKVHSAAIQERSVHGWSTCGSILGWSVDVVGHPPKPRGVWAPIGAVIDWEALRPKGFQGVLPRRWVVESSHL